MRLKHEFISVNRICSDIFNHPDLVDLKLRWFDPTQAYCEDRIDKGLSEALMLKRVKCTIYLAQESDTLGKDSELATTLAQGKPVIAFIPEVNEAFFENFIKDFRLVNPSFNSKRILLEVLKIISPDIPWTQKKIRNILDNPSRIKTEELKKFVFKKFKEHYNKRAKTLKEDHPLGIQVNLDTGVANGLLVVRNLNNCVQLVKAILTSSMDFDLEKITKDKREYIILKEKISGCVYRIVTGDELLTNSFWNFYLNSNNNLALGGYKYVQN